MTDHIGRYEYRDDIGEGGMAVVLRARDPHFQRDVAIKILPIDASEANTEKRFLREARAVASLEHPAIVPLYDYGEYEGRPYIVMRYMSGGSLHERLRGEGPVSLTQAAAIVERIGSALDATHAHNIIHRDLKPANILFDRYDNAYLSDFGIVRLAEQSVRLTQGGVLGTPQYMAPEMVKSDGVSKLADIYALTVTLFEMLTGVRPYDGKRPIEIVRAHINAPIPDVRIVRSDIPDAVQQVIEKGMAKKREDRYQAAGELAEDFQAAIAETPEDLAPTLLPKTNLEVDADSEAVLHVIPVSDEMDLDKESVPGFQRASLSTNVEQGGVPRETEPVARVVQSDAKPRKKVEATIPDLDVSGVRDHTPEHLKGTKEHEQAYSKPDQKGTEEHSRSDYQKPSHLKATVEAKRAEVIKHTERLTPNYQTVERPVPQSSAYAQPQPIHKPSPQSGQKKNKRGGFGIVVAVIGVLILLAGIAMLALYLLR